jgi:2-dehydropantoate 2-reductase
VSADVAILGPGGVGGFLAGALERAGTKTTLVAREATAQALRREGLRIHSVALDAAWESHPRVVTRLREPAEVLLVATKAVGLERALDRIAKPPALVLPLLNGLDHLAVLQERFGADHVVAAAIRVQSDRTAAGVVDQTSAVARIDIADSPHPGVPAAVVVLRNAGLDVRVGGTAGDVLWAKLARLAAIAATTTAFDATLGEIRRDPERLAALERCIRETAAVAAAEGVHGVDAEATIAEVAALRDDQSSSMARDVAAGREPELDAILGAVLRAGARHDLGCPAIAGLVRDIERRRAGSAS